MEPINAPNNLIALLPLGPDPAPPPFDASLVSSTAPLTPTFPDKQTATVAADPGFLVEWSAWVSQQQTKSSHGEPGGVSPRSTPPSQPHDDPLGVDLEQQLVDHLAAVQDRRDAGPTNTSPPALLPDNSGGGGGKSGANAPSPTDAGSTTPPANAPAGPAGANQLRQLASVASGQGQSQSPTEGHSAHAAVEKTFVDHDWANLAAGSVVFFPGDHRPLVIGLDAFAKIQDGVNHTKPGGTEKVAAGTYTEQVKIGQSLTLLGAGRDITTIQNPGALTRNAATGQTAIVDIGNAAHVSIQGFTVSGPGLTYADLNYGIFVGSNADLNISNAHITHIRDFQFSGVQSGVGIRIGANFAHQVATGTIRNVTIDDYQKGGIVIDGIIGGPSSYATVTGSTITGAGMTPLIAQNGVQVSRGANATITDNTISDNYYTGPDTGTGSLFYLSDPADSTIRGNNFSGNQYDIIDATTTTTLATSANPTAVGDAVTFTATVAQRTPSTPLSPTPLPGTVQFVVDGAAVGSPQSLDANNQADLTIATLTAGSHTIEADYSGSNLLEANPSSAAITQVVSSGPVAQDQIYTVFKNRTLNVAAANGLLVGDYGPQGSPLSALLVSGPSDGRLSLKADGSFAYTPKKGFVGTDTFTYEAVDALGEKSLPATVQLLIAQAKSAKKGPEITKPGTAVPSDKIGGGTVDAGGVRGKLTARTGVSYFIWYKGKKTAVRNNAIQIAYDGKNAEQMRIVQFVWRTVAVTQGGKTTLVNVPIKPSSGPSYRSTTDPNKPNYIVDSTDKKNPLFLARGVGETVPGKTTYILDRPSDWAKDIYDENYRNNPAVTKVVSVGHYDVYFFLDGKAVYHVSWTSTSTWEKGKPSLPPVNAVTGGGPNQGPNAAQLAALKKQYPDYEKFLK